MPCSTRTSEEEYNSAVYQLVASIVSLIIITLIIVFFYKNLFHPIHKKCILVWWPLGLFLYIIAIIYFFIAIVMIVLASINVSKNDPPNNHSLKNIKNFSKKN